MAREQGPREDHAIAEAIREKVKDTTKGITAAFVAYKKEHAGHWEDITIPVLSDSPNYEIMIGVNAYDLAHMDKNKHDKAIQELDAFVREICQTYGLKSTTYDRSKLFTRMYVLKGNLS